MSHFVTTDWLEAHLADPDVQVIDASWHMPNAGRDGYGEYVVSHIPGAIFFDIDAVSDTHSELPHMLATPHDFGEMAGALGIGSDTTLVVYDEPGLFSAARAWWTLRTMGAKTVKILEGGGSKWRTEGRPLESGESTATPRTFTARFDASALARYDDVLEASRSGAQILDARAAARFRGEVPEPRPGLRSGHIPNSKNLPFDTLIENGALKSGSDLERAIRDAGIDPDRPVITSCGSGVTASVLALALDTIGARNVRVYDGSWSEWGGREDAPIETGPAQSRSA